MYTKSIHIGEHTVTKTDEPRLIRIEVEKSRQASRIGEACGLFCVPDVLDFDEDKGLAVFKRIERIAPIRQVISRHEEYIALVGNLGAALAVIHRELQLPADMLLPLPAQFSSSHNEVFFHGDLSVDNVCVGVKNPPLVILDWQMTPVHGGNATYGTGYFDLMWFVFNLLYRPTIRHLFGNPTAKVLRVFFESYFSEANVNYDSDDIRSYADNFFQANLPYITKAPLSRKARLKQRVFLPRCHALKREFIRTL